MLGTCHGEKLALRLHDVVLASKLHARVGKCGVDGFHRLTRTKKAGTCVMMTNSASTRDLHEKNPAHGPFKSQLVLTMITDIQSAVNSMVNMKRGACNLNCV
jgi:hypothetical protein